MKRKKADRDPSSGRFQPGNGLRWQPGASGNPSGTARDARKLAEAFGTQVNPKTGRSRDEHLLQLVYRQACQGSVRSQELYFAYRWGKPVQYSVTAELTPEQKVNAMTEDEMHAWLAERWERMSSKGPIQ